MQREILGGAGVVLLAGVAATYLVANSSADSGKAGKAPVTATGGGAVAGAAIPGPDVIVGSMNGTWRWATDAERTAYSFGTTSCNIGSDDLQWIDEGGLDLYPVIGQNMFRMSIESLPGGGTDTRFEQIGMGWLKHAFCALQGQLCENCNPFCGECQSYCTGCCDHLGPGCSDPYSAQLNGSQGGLGPRWDVNALTGQHPADPIGPALETAFDRRVVVDNDDLDAALNPGALYFIEGQYVTKDDAQWGHQNNNASYRKVTVGAAPDYFLALDGGTVKMDQAVRAWKAFDPAVTLHEVQVPGEGLFILGYKVTDRGDGTWHYEYALYNMNSHRSADRFSVPVGENVVLSNVAFRDVDYHSGEPWDTTDWAAAEGGGDVTWATQEFALNENANALRWGTLYNFRFDADSPPVAVKAGFHLFRPGGPKDPDWMTVDALGPGPVEAEPCPADVNGDGTVDVRDLIKVIMAWGGDDPSADVDGNGVVAVPDLIAVINDWGPCP